MAYVLSFRLRFWRPETAHLYTTWVRTFCSTTTPWWTRHMGVDKTYDVIRPKNCRPNLYKRLYSYIEGYVICQTKTNKRTHLNLKRQTYHLFFLMDKVGLDSSGPYQNFIVRKRVYSFFHWHLLWMARSLPRSRQVSWQYIAPYIGNISPKKWLSSSDSHRQWNKECK